MTKILTLFILVCLLISSCNNPTTTKVNIAQNNSTNDQPDIAKLNDALKKYEDPSQIFKVSSPWCVAHATTNLIHFKNPKHI